MYAVADTLPVGQLDPGTFLLSGPAMSGKYEVLLDLATEGIRHGDGVLFVTTNQDAGSVIADVESRVGEPPGRFRVVDSVSERQGSDDRLPAGRVEYASSPGDLTGIGIGVSEHLRRFAASDVERTRVGFYSLSTLLMYTEIETVFRFLHVLVGRVDGLEGLGLFAIDPTTHDEGTVNTLKQLVDGVIEVRSVDAGHEIRVVGVPGISDGWMPRP